MFRNQYDSDNTIWSPQGRLHQVEYAMEAVKQGSATVGLKSNTHAVLVALKRASSELSSHQKKILPIDDHVGISIAGLTADARTISRWMRTECLNSRYAHDSALPLCRMIEGLGNKMQLTTQRAGKRPYGVGLLIAGYDDLGPHIFQTCPDSNYYDCRAMAIGARSQAARTYLEKFLGDFYECSLEELVKHGLRALRDTLPNEVDLTNKNVSIAVVGKDTPFVIHDDASVEPFLAGIEGEERRGQRAAAEPSQDQGEAAPEEGAEAASAGMDTDE